MLIHILLIIISNIKKEMKNAKVDKNNTLFYPILQFNFELEIFFFKSNIYYLIRFNKFPGI